MHAPCGFTHAHARGLRASWPANAARCAWSTQPGRRPAARGTLPVTHLQDSRTHGAARCRNQQNPVHRLRVPKQLKELDCLHRWLGRGRQQRVGLPAPGCKLLHLAIGVAIGVAQKRRLQGGLGKGQNEFANKSHWLKAQSVALHERTRRGARESCSGAPFQPSALWELQFRHPPPPPLSPQEKHFCTHASAPQLHFAALRCAGAGTPAAATSPATAPPRPLHPAGAAH
jgi:hypothetical protein